jgi:hypothetical protein
MKEVQVTYTILATIEVPDDFSEEEIQQECVNYYFCAAEMGYNDLEWDIKR